MYISTDAESSMRYLTPAHYTDSKNRNEYVGFAPEPFWRGRFYRDKFSGPRPKRPNLKLTDMTLDRVIIEDQPTASGTRVQVTPSFWIEVSGGLGRLGATKSNPPLGDGIPSLPNQQNVIDQLIIDAHNKALEPDFDVPMFLAELGETLSMLRNPLKGLKKFVRRKKSIGSFTEMLSDQWLQYRYGIKPLVSDIDKAATVVSAAQHRYANIIRKSSSYRETLNTKNVTTNNYIPWARFNQITSVIERNNVSVTCSRFYHWENNVYSPLLQGNAIGLLWEMIPYSFVVDWFIGIGDFISTFRTNPLLHHLGYTCTVKQIYSKEFIPLSVAYPGYPFHALTIDPGYYRWSIERKSRTRPSLPAWPVVNWGFNDINHLVDGLALTFQQIIGKRS